MKTRIPQGVLVQCPKCGQSCNGGKGLSTHMRNHKLKPTEGQLAKLAAQPEVASAIQDWDKRKKKYARAYQKNRRMGLQGVEDVTPTPKRAYKRRAIAQKRTETSPNPPSPTELHFRYCPACGAALAQMEAIITAGMKVRES